MDLLRTDQNAWGQEVLLGISWDLLPVFAGAGIVIIVLHALFKALWEPVIGSRGDERRR